MISLTPHAELLEEGAGRGCEVRARLFGCSLPGRLGQVGSPFQDQWWLPAPKTIQKITVATCAGAWGTPTETCVPRTNPPKLRPPKEGSREKPNQIQYLITQVQKTSNHIEYYSKVL